MCLYRHLEAERLCEIKCVLFVTYVCVCVCVSVIAVEGWKECDDVLEGA